jgi:environmental stress-induced protein Ves
VTAPILISADAVSAQPWRNGGGRTRELLTRPSGADNWRLRISLAEVDREGPFSSFPGVERWFSVLAGAGVRLSIDGHEHLLRPGDAPIRFGGTVPVSCRPLAGTTTDLNLMHMGGTGCMQLAQSGVAWHSALSHRGLFTLSGGLWRTGSAAPLTVSPRSLLWVDEAAAGEWTYFAAESDSAATALWLGFGD